MIDRYLSPAQLSEILSISKRQAYNIIYQLPHIEGPLRVSERVLKNWLEQSTIYPAKRRSA